MKRSVARASKDLLGPLLLVVLGLWLVVSPASAHKPSDSYLQLRTEEGRTSGQWDIALRDLDYAIGLDSDGDGTLTWGEVRARAPEVQAYAFSRLKLATPDGQTCPTVPTGYLVDRHSDGAYVVLRFDARCAAEVASLQVAYDLFFDLDPQHRGLLQYSQPGTRPETQAQVRTAIFSPTNRVQQLTLKTHPLAQFFDFCREGIWHIWIGFDHVLFLLTLLLPAVLERKDGHWKPGTDLGTVLGNTFKVVTAFTLAHSLTLGLAALGIVELPSRWVEATIAASVVLAALNNLFPLVTERRWAVALGFGLIHGFGFAGVLSELGLPRESLLLSLAGFNIGVEVGQLAIVALCLPVAFWMRDSWFYRRVVFTGGSLAVASIAAVWLAERLFDWKILAF